MPETTPTPIAVTDEQLARVRDDAAGLAPAIVQDAATGQVLMMAWVNEETLRLSLADGRTVFWSRSRQEVWRKGDTSGDVQWLRAAYYNCDGDTLLFVVDQQGAGACHTGERTCFFRALSRGVRRVDRRRALRDPLVVHVETDPSVIWAGMPPWIGAGFLVPPDVDVSSPPGHRPDWRTWAQERGGVDESLTQLRVTLTAR